MSYKLFTDKPNKFNCDIQIEGTSLSKSKVRLVLETEDISYMFYGKIENNGVCEVLIPKTKNFLSEGTIGNIKLEVIADDVFFEPWSSQFNVKTDKKVNVKIKENYNYQEEENKKPIYEDRKKVTVNVQQQPKEPEITVDDIERVLESFSKTNKKKPQSNEKVFFTKKDILKRLI